MSKAPEPAAPPDDIVFELERFHRSDGRLTLNGRWFGIRGRRFVRPTLTLAIDGDRVRALADLDDKPWAAEDGEPWKATFPLRTPGRVAPSELSVAPDITIRLPAPNGKRERSQRLAAMPRRDAMSASWGDLAAAIEAPPADAEAEPAPVEAEPAAAVEAGGGAQLVDTSGGSALTPAELESVKSELAMARADVDTTGADLAKAHAELEAARGEIEAAHGELVATRAEIEAARAEVEAAATARDDALKSAAQAEAEREAALTRAAEAEAERDALVDERAQAAAALEQTQALAERLSRERDDAFASRGAALVMRGATQALPAHQRHVGWVRRALALVVLIGVVIAALIIANVL